MLFMQCCLLFLEFSHYFPTITTGCIHHRVLNFLVLCPCASVGCNVKCMSFAHVLHYLAGAVAPDLPVWKPLQPVFLVVNAIFVSFRLLHGIFALPKF